jgi:hypothetical protein
MFMGVAKAIYGATILLNPLFGLFGDKVVTLSHGTGRRLFVCSGVCVASIGILMCIYAGNHHRFYSFVCGILLWRLGEALNDVTTEALVPEMVPQAQYQLASAVKACSFLMGGLFGYGMLMNMTGVHYSWLYYAYLAGMFSCALPSLALLRDDAPGKGLRRSTSSSFTQCLFDAYVIPTTYKGGFNRACLSVFIFSLGTAPMFFLLLLIRDLVGITEQTQLQETFSCASIIFFLSAATAAVLSAPGGGVEKDTSGDDADVEARLDRIRQHKVYILLGSMTTFGLCCFAIPLLNLFDDVYSRQTLFYVIAIVFGASFGMAFSRFQDCTWAELPSNAVVANAMGFNVMSRLFGVGLGNLIAGIILDQFYTGDAFVGAVNPVELKKQAEPIASGLLQLLRPTEQHDISQVYLPMGYTLMCSYCGILVLCSCYVAYDGMLRGSLKSQLAAERLSPRAQAAQ